MRANVLKLGLPMHYFQDQKNKFALIEPGHAKTVFEQLFVVYKHAFVFGLHSMVLSLSFLLIFIMIFSLILARTLVRRAKPPRLPQ